MLPEGIGPGDYIVFDMMGAYSVAVRTTFNGFYPQANASARPKTIQFTTISGT